MAEYFDIKAWIKKYFKLNLADNTFENTNNSLEFIWVWSIFEHNYLKDSWRTKSYNEQLIDIASKFPTKNINIDKTYRFLHDRYIKDGNTTIYFGNLNFKKKWHKLSLKILAKNEPSSTDKLKLILLVLYKFRCNLFHGRKDPLLWQDFDEVFFYLNKFLADFLDTKWTN